MSDQPAKKRKIRGLVVASAVVVGALGLGYATNNEQLEEVFENLEQIAVSKYYERLPKPWSIAMKELMNDDIYIKNHEEESDSESEKKDA